MQTISIAGNIGKDAETRQTNKGAVTSFSVGVSAGRDAATTWYRCSLWGTRGEKLAGYLTKGGKVSVVGGLEAGLYDGKLDLKVNVFEVALQGSRDNASSAPARQSPKPAPDDLDDDLDSDEIPF